jgi:hypothetical protein
VLLSSVSSDTTKEQQQPLEHFSKLRVSQLQTFLKERGQQWDFAEKSTLTWPRPWLLLLLLLLLLLSS